MKQMENTTHGVTCIDCGDEFARKRGYVGNYCSECRQ